MFFALLLAVEKVQAYIDPGTAGMIISTSIWPFILALSAAIGGFMLKYFLKPIKKFSLTIWKKVKGED